MDFNHKLRSLLRSRRFYAALGGLLSVVLFQLLGVPEEITLGVVGMVAAWIVGDSLSKTGSQDAR